MYILPDEVNYCEDILRDVRRGQQRIVSRPGSGQYIHPASGSASSDSKQEAISTSACGLAVLHCARVLLKASPTEEDALFPDAGGVYERTLVEALVSPETAEEIARVCSLWSRDEHLDIEDILATPSFENTFEIVETRFGKATLRGLNSVLGSPLKVDVRNKGPLAIVITRPPEILLCLKIETISDTLFIVYDSHPRPQHPEGSAFILNNSLPATARYLAGILAVDQSLLNDPSLQWQAQLLAQFSAHFLVRNPALVENSKVEWSGVESAIKILELQLELASMRGRLRESEDALRKAEANQAKQKESSTSFLKKLQKNSSPRNKRTSNSPPQPKSAREHADAGDDLDAHLARALQESHDEEARRRDFEHASFVQQYQDAEKGFDCGVCLETYSISNVFVVSQCQHRYCRECIRGYVDSKLNERRYPILCPMCSAEARARPSSLEQDSLALLGLAKLQMDIYNDLQLAAHSFLIHCRKCQSSVFVDRREYQQTKLVACPLPRCDNVWCKHCQQTIQTDAASGSTRRLQQHSCDGSLELDALMKTQGWKHCPGCKTPIIRESGCNHMTCVSPGCNAHFCYVCGKMITSSLNRNDIQDSVSRHYQAKCLLF